MDSYKLNVLLGKVISTAKDTGSWILTERENFSADKVEIKGLNDLVSYVDKGAEQRIVTELTNHFPANFIAEENTQSGGTHEYTWIVDPLDGTTNFVHNIPCYCISIALQWKNEIILGVVYEVNRDECFHALKDAGSYLNFQSIRVSQSKKLSDSLIATGFPIYNFDRIEPYFKTLEKCMRNTHGVRRIGSAAADLCYLACGRVDGFFEYNLNPWDVAAGALIVREAGGYVSDFKGGDNWLFGKELFATNGKITEEFRQLMQF
ncbi:MAG: inositol monophosphatase [Bacteroidetes bacterium]|jgi:myo-inositol-1(or 4)-monophosphatase|nr:inositol monophosphatase [Bacteroidota bacterium]